MTITIGRPFVPVSVCFYSYRYPFLFGRYLQVLFRTLLPCHILCLYYWEESGFCCAWSSAVKGTWGVLYYNRVLSIGRQQYHSNPMAWEYIHAALVSVLALVLVSAGLPSMDGVFL